MTPMTDPALAVELGTRVCLALMNGDDWDESLDRVLSWPPGLSPSSVAGEGHGRGEDDAARPRAAAPVPSLTEPKPPSPAAGLSGCGSSEAD